jgi:hypothetical protein
MWLLGNWSQMKFIVEQDKQVMVTVTRCYYTSSVMCIELTQDLEHSAACHHAAAIRFLWGRWKLIDKYVQSILVPMISPSVLLLKLRDIRRKRGSVTPNATNFLSDKSSRSTWPEILMGICFNFVFLGNTVSSYS